MARDLSSLPILKTADELLSFLREDPNDRFIWCSSDLDPTDFTDGLRNRSDDLVLVVSSLRAQGVSRLSEFLDSIFGRDRVAGPYPDELAVIGPDINRDALGREIPADIVLLLTDAERLVKGCALSWANFSLCVLAEHPEARP